MSYYVRQEVKQTVESTAGNWCVFKERKYWFDKKVASFSVYIYGTNKAKELAIDAKELYSKQDKELEE